MPLFHALFLELGGHVFGAAKIAEQYPYLEENGILDELIPKKTPILLAKWFVHTCSSNLLLGMRHDSPHITFVGWNLIYYDELTTQMLSEYHLQSRGSKSSNLCGVSCTWPQTSRIRVVAETVLFADFSILGFRPGLSQSSHMDRGRGASFISRLWNQCF